MTKIAEAKMLATRYANALVAEIQNDNEAAMWRTMQKRIAEQAMRAGLVIATEGDEDAPVTVTVSTVSGAVLASVTQDWR